MQDSAGFFYYRQYPLIKARTPMLHWGQATMFKGLAELFLQRELAGHERCRHSLTASLMIGVMRNPSEIAVHT